MEAIYAIDSKGGLSKNGAIPWKSKKDMLFFMNKTKNNVVVMGKNTYFSIPLPHRPLKNRFNIVLTRQQSLYNNITDEYPNVLFTDCIAKDILTNKEKYCAIYTFLKVDFKIFIIGGKSIYEQFIPLCDKIWITYIKYDYNCDLFFNYENLKEFKENVYDEDETLKIMEYIR